MTSEMLAKELRVSVRTMKTILKELRKDLPSFGCELLVKRGSGYRLQVKEESRFQSLQKTFHRQQMDRLPMTQKEREEYIIRKLLSVDYPIRIGDLADELFVSRNTVSHDVRKVRSFLKSYDMSMLQGNEGIHLEGSEMQKRKCIRVAFFQDTEDVFYAHENTMFLSEYNQNQIRYIREALLHVLNRKGIRFSDLSVQNMVIHIMIGIRRIRFYQYVEIDEKIRREVTASREYRAALELKEKLEEQLHVIYPPDEVIYLAMHMIAKAIADSSGVFSVCSRVDDRVMSDLCREVEARFPINIREDGDLYSFLNLHIQAMVKRLYLNMSIRNPQYMQYICHYPYAVEISLLVGDILKEHFRIRLDENELAYLVVYFNLALSRRLHRRKKRLILVSGYGRPEMIVTLNRLNEDFKGFMEEVVTCDAFELEHFPFEADDIVVTTVPINEPIEVPLVYVKDQVEAYHSQILKLLQSSHRSGLRPEKYLHREFFISGVSCRSREDAKECFRLMLQARFSCPVAEKLCGRIYDLGNETGNGTACLHSRVDAPQPFVAFICLKHEVLWEKTNVKYIFLLNMNREKDKEIVTQIYEMAAAWCEDKSKIQKFERSRSYETLLETLKEG